MDNTDVDAPKPTTEDIRLLKRETFSAAGQHLGSYVNGTAVRAPRGVIFVPTQVHERLEPLPGESIRALFPQEEAHRRAVAAENACHETIHLALISTTQLSVLGASVVARTSPTRRTSTAGATRILAPRLLDLCSRVARSGLVVAHA
jgi:hypothetical protein